MFVSAVCSCVRWHCAAARAALRESYGRVAWPANSASLDFSRN